MAQIRAIVVSIGDTCWFDKPGSRHWAKVGDTVLIAKYSGLYLEGQDEKTYRIISDLDVIAVKERE